MALNAYAQFHSFDWLNNADWLSYKANLEIPNDSSDLLLKKRQKWFKANVNADYDPGFKPAAARDGTEASKSEKPDNPSNSDNLGEKKAARDDRTKMSITRVVLLTMNLLTIAHVILAIVNLVYPVLLEMNHFTFAWAHSCVSYAIILFMSVGRPQFNLDWVKTALNSDNTHYIMYCMIFLVSSHPRPVALLPILIYSIINVSILLPRFLASFAFPVVLINRISSRIKESKRHLLLSGSNFELATFASLLFEVITGDFNGLLPLVLMWNFITSRWHASSWTRTSVSSIEALLDSYLLSSKCPSIVSGLYLQIKSLIVRFGAPRQQARYA
jgi:hypothetical protein